jgi:hypothetical protein
LKSFLALLLIVNFTTDTVFAKMAAGAQASMAPPMPRESFAASKAVEFYTKKQRTEKLNSEETHILKLSLLAQDVFSIKDFSIPAHLSTESAKIKAINSMYIISLIRQNIDAKSNWDEPLSKENLEKIKANIEFFKNSANETSASSAWISYQMGDKQEAKKILATNFENSYTHVIQLKGTYGHRSSPLNEAERVSKLLVPMSTNDENKSREDKLKKMRTHISTLPDMQIMT